MLRACIFVALFGTSLQVDPACPQTTYALGDKQIWFSQEAIGSYAEAFSSCLKCKSNILAIENPGDISIITGYFDSVQDNLNSYLVDGIEWQGLQVYLQHNTNGNLNITLVPDDVLQEIQNQESGSSSVARKRVTVIPKQTKAPKSLGGDGIDILQMRVGVICVNDPGTSIVTGIEDPVCPETSYALGDRSIWFSQEAIGSYAEAFSSCQNCKSNILAIETPGDIDIITGYFDSVQDGLNSYLVDGIEWQGVQVYLQHNSSGNLNIALIPDGVLQEIQFQEPSCCSVGRDQVIVIPKHTKTPTSLNGDGIDIIQMRVGVICIHDVNPGTSTITGEQTSSATGGEEAGASPTSM